jgi:hypothetical protein
MESREGIEGTPSNCKTSPVKNREVMISISAVAISYAVRRGHAIAQGKRAVLNEPIARLFPTLHTALERLGIRVSHVSQFGCLTGRAFLIVSGAIEYDLLVLGQCRKPRFEFTERYGAFEAARFEFLFIVIRADQEGSTRVQLFKGFSWSNALRLTHVDLLAMCFGQEMAL